MYRYDNVQEQVCRQKYIGTPHVQGYAPLSTVLHQRILLKGNEIQYPGDSHHRVSPLSPDTRRNGQAISYNKSKLLSWNNLEYRPNHNVNSRQQ